MKHLFLCLLLLSCKATNLDITPNDIRERVSKNGAKFLINELAYTPQWDVILNNIEEGSDEWLDIYFLLYEGSDAGSSTDLSYSFLNAFPKAPYKIIDMQLKEYNNSYTATNLCTFTFEYDEPKVGISSFLSELELSLAKGKSQKNEDIFNQCMNGIAKTKTSLNIK